MGIRDWLKRLRAEEDAEALAEAQNVIEAKEGERWLAEEDPKARALDEGLTRGAVTPNPDDL